MKKCKDKMKRRLKEAKALPKSIKLNQKQRKFLIALECGVDTFVAYFKGFGISEDLLRFQSRESATMLLVEELTKLQIPRHFLISMADKRWIRIQKTPNIKTVLTLELTDLFFESERPVADLERIPWLRSKSRVPIATD